eukprot:TRINITY_DN2628_c3_g1_i1.p1 TRINITY_DN2628_c3_g1~~TRINITY_DN2628_c3_g1_i1.p1  ORF type:complete len:463 (+),score=184.82 TRINITY_DN2628_c3_g1_i1:84-1391(+)
MAGYDARAWQGGYPPQQQYPQGYPQTQAPGPQVPQQYQQPPQGYGQWQQPAPQQMAPQHQHHHWGQSRMDQGGWQQQPVYQHPSQPRFLQLRQKYVEHEKVEVKRTSGAWDMGVIDRIWPVENDFGYRVLVCKPDFTPTGIWKDLIGPDVDAYVRKLSPKPTSGDPELDARVERKLRMIESSAGHAPSSQPAEAAKRGGGGGGEEGQEARIDAKLREIELRCGKPGPPQPSVVRAPGGGEMDADLNARIEARLRKAEELAAQNKKDREAGKVIHSDKPVGDGVSVPSDDDRDSMLPGSDDEKWLDEQLGPGEADALDPDDDDENAVIDEHRKWIEEQEALGRAVRGVCPVCCFEVLDDMPRFKIDDQYYHEACRADASAAAKGKGKGKGAGSAAAPPPPEPAAAPAPAAATEEEAQSPTSRAVESQLPQSPVAGQ